MKYQLHVPTVQYGFILAEMESDSPQEVCVAYRALQEAWEGAEGISEKDFDAFIQNQLSGDGNHVDILDKLSPTQQKHYQINKRAINRIKYKTREI